VLYRIEHRGRVDVDAALRQRLGDVRVGQSVIQVPANGRGDDADGEAVAAER